MTPTLIRCIVNGANGIYTPMAFAENYSVLNSGSLDQWHVSDEDTAILKAGPDHELYWDTWDSVLSSAYFHQEESKYSEILPGKWTLHLGESGDLFTVHETWEEE